MIRIRFHGRGGQGMKTASRIVGTAAFRQGYYAQDSPVYGAERRGAPMIAFTRFGTQPILERGFVSSPDLLVIADESLLSDPQVRALQGVSPNASILVNSPHGNDFTTLALSHTGSTSALSVALGAAGAKLAGIGKQFVEEAVREEMQALGLRGSRVQQNIELARASFEIASNCSLTAPKAEATNMRIALVTPTYDGPWAGTASVASPPNTPLRKTGDWRVKRPVIDLDRCTHCWICYVHCPDGAISLTTEDVPQIDYGVCKGCLMCAEECPIDAIDSLREAGEAQTRQPVALGDFR
jgi:pyruvate ferredoxin oxidoreductase gamma subunit